MTAAASGLSPASAGLCRLLDASLADGHTVVPVAMAGAALGGVRLRLENALREIGPAGSGLVSAPTPSLLGYRRVVDAEQAVAAAVSRLAGTGRLRVVAGPAGAARDAAAAGHDAVVDDAEHLDIETLAVLFASCDDGETVVLAGDPCGLGSPGAGRGFADIAESGVVDVVSVDADEADRADQASGGTVLRHLAAAIARGELPAVDDPTREVVTVVASSGAEAAHRVRQLVGDSIPRAVGVDRSQIQVLTPTRAGPCGSRALAAALHDLGAPAPLTVHESLGRRWPAVVLALPPESSSLLSRPLLYSAVTRAIGHLSIVHAAGGALADAVAATPRRRRTLLATLLAAEPTGYSSSGSHSRSSSSSSTPSTGPNGVTSSYAENSASS